MKRKKRTCKLKTGMLITLAAVSLIGCGQEPEIDYSIEGVSEEMVESETPVTLGGKSGLDQFKGEEAWKDTWTVKSGEEEQNGQMVEQTTEVQVDAKISIPQTKQMSVVEVTEPEFDAEFMENVAENLFDSGEIYYGDAAHLPKKELLEGRWITGELIVLNEIMREEEERSAALENIDSAGEFYTPVEDYNVNRYMGSYDERMYTLIFTESTEETGECRRKQIYFSVNDISEFYPEKFEKQDWLDCTPWTQGDWVENHCELSEADALKDAIKFVEQLGLEYPVVSQSYPLLWEDLLNKPLEYVEDAEESDAWTVHGYVFCFDLGVDDLSFVDFGVENEYDSFQFESKNNKELQYSLRSELQVYVTDRGIIRMVADNPMEITSVSEGVELLSLDTIQGIMKEYAEENWENIRTLASNTYSSNLDTMELIYFRVRDKENPGKYSYVPTWRLANVTKDITSRKMSIMNQVLINAIDGSVIDLFDET